MVLLEVIDDECANCFEHGGTVLENDNCNRLSDALMFNDRVANGFRMLDKLE